jgi:adenine-specific DNA methylase
MRYYGCKTKLLDYIEDVTSSLHLREGSVFFDMFSGTSAVGQHFKKLGYTVYANDFLEFAYALAYCYIQLNGVPKFSKLSKNIKNIHNPEQVIEYLNNIAGKAGFITKSYSPYLDNKRRYLSVENAKKVDAIRECIYKWQESKWINKDEYYYLITALVEGINLVSNITGTYAAYLKTWDNRALKKIKLVPPKLIGSNRENLATRGDANKIIADYKVDILYLDPPYNSRQFAANYFFPELVAKGWFDKKPEIFGQAGMPDYKNQKSAYSIRNQAAEALQDLVKKARAKYILLSYNDEGIIPLPEIKKILKTRGLVSEFTKEHKRYRAINQDGSHSHTHEFLFLVKVTK